MDETSDGKKTLKVKQCCPRNGRSTCTMRRLIYEAKAAGARDPARSLMCAGVLLLLERGATASDVWRLMLRAKLFAQELAEVNSREP